MNDLHRSKPLPVDMEEVARVNVDLGTRIEQEGVEFAYDSDGDTLFATIGEKPRYALTEEIMGNIYVRIDPGTLKIVGATVFDFMADFLAHNRLAQKAFAGFFDLLRQEGTIMVEGTDARVRVAPIFEAILKLS